MRVSIIEQQKFKTDYTVVSFAISNGYKVYTLRDEVGNMLILQIELEFWYAW